VLVVHDPLVEEVQHVAGLVGGLIAEKEKEILKGALHA